MIGADFRPCLHCQGPFRPSRATQRHCSPFCRFRHRERRDQARRKRARDRCKKCARLACRKVFWTRMTSRIFCGRPCAIAASNKARTAFKQAERRISQRAKEA